MDLSHAATSFVEKALDDHSCGAIAQLNLSKYFDNLPVVPMLRWLERQGVERDLLTAIPRRQSLVHIVVCCGPSIRRRSSGGLTGSFLALLLARVPDESTFFELKETMEVCSFRLDLEHGQRLFACSCIDNCYFVSRYGSGASVQAELFARHLQDCWSLEIKAGSKQLLICKGGDTSDVIADDWEVLHTVEVLGWPVQADGVYSVLWAKLLSKMWRSFWANCRCRGWRALNLPRMMKLMNRAIEPLVLFYLSPVPPESRFVEELNKVQRKMVRLVMRLFRYPLESHGHFASRASRAAAHAIEVHSRWWALRWVQRTEKWYRHLLRDYDRQDLVWSKVRSEALDTSFSWASLLLRHHNAQWLAGRRVLTPTSSRTDTRLASLGRPHARWEESVIRARCLY